MDNIKLNLCRNVKFTMKIYQIKNKQQLKAQLSYLKSNLRAQEAEMLQVTKAYLNHKSQKLLGKNKSSKPPELAPKSIQHYLDGKVLIHILPQFMNKFLSKKSGWLSRFGLNLISKKLGKSLDKVYFNPK